MYSLPAARAPSDAGVGADQPAAVKVGYKAVAALTLLRDWVQATLQVPSACMAVRAALVWAQSQRHSLRPWDPHDVVGVEPPPPLGQFRSQDRIFDPGVLPPGVPALLALREVLFGSRGGAVDHC